MSTGKNGAEADEPALDGLIVVVGNARLPQGLAGDGERGLLLEITVEPVEERIKDVAANIQLPAYVGLLQHLLVGRSVHNLEGALAALQAQLRGPLLRPTVAALLHAVSNCATGATRSGHHAGP